MSPRPLDWERIKQQVPEVPRIRDSFGPAPALVRGSETTNEIEPPDAHEASA